MRPREGEPILIFVLSKSSSSYIFTTDLDKILSGTLVHRQLDTYRKILYPGGSDFKLRGRIFREKVLQVCEVGGSERIRIEIFKFS